MSSWPAVRDFRALRINVATNNRSKQKKAIIWSVEANPSLPTSWENTIGNTTPADHTLPSDLREEIQGERRLPPKDAPAETIPEAAARFLTNHWPATM